MRRRGHAHAATGRHAEIATLLGVVSALLTAANANAQVALDQVVLEDAIAVEILDRNVIAFDLQGSGRLKFRLDLDEEVLWSSARGRVAIVVTSRRLLGATPRSAAWQVERYRLNETPPPAAQLSQRLAVAITSQRVLGFFGDGTWTEVKLSLRESIVNTHVGPGAAVVVTDRRALGLSSSSGGFFETGLQIREEIASVRTLSSIATVTTSYRTLVFKGPSGRWTSEERSPR